MKPKALTVLTLALALAMVASTVLAAPSGSGLWSPEKQALDWSQRQIDGFDPGTDITTDSQLTRSIAVGDVNGDNKLDVIAGNDGQVNRLYLNNGTANPFFGVTGTNISADTQATTSVALGDVDGDGDLDLVVGNFNQTNRLYLNNGTADPFNGVSGSDITSDAQATFSVALGDVNGDGRLDLVVGNSNQPNRLYLNNGTANPFNGVTGTDISADANNTRAVALGDINGDGRLDVVAGNASLQANRLYLNNGTADPFNGVTGANITTDGHNTTSVALGDMNGDGRLDVVAGNDRNDTILQPNRLYLNNGGANPFPGASASNITADNQDTFSLALGDVDGDGDLDLVAGNLGQVNRLYLNNGTINPFNGVTGENVTADAQSTLSVALADMDGDGDRDLVAGNFNARNRLYLNNTPLAVTLASFTAQGGVDRVTVTWETVSEFNNAGFNLYRGLQADGSDRALLASVPAQSPGSTQGAAYSYEDAAVEAGQTYWYWLEDIDLSGATTLHGPVSATVSVPTAVTLTSVSASPAAATGAGLAWLLAVAGLAGAAGAVLRRRRW